MKRKHGIIDHENYNQTGSGNGKVSSGPGAGKEAGGDAETSKASWKAPREKTKLSFKEQREYDSIESEIEALEEKSAELEIQIAESATDYPKLVALTKEKEEVDAEIERKMDRFIELQEMVDSFQSDK